MPMLLADLPLVDPQSLKDDCDRMGINTDKWWGKANSFVVPLHSFDGAVCGTGWLLMSALTYPSLPADTTAMDLFWADPFGRTLTLKKVCLVSTEAVTWSDPTNVGAEYLLTVADRRYRLNQIAVSREYNTRLPTNEYVGASLDGTSPWTWAGCLQDIWAKMAAVYTDLGTAPAFPSAPAGTPEGFYFYDEGAWEAAWRVVEAAGFLLVYDPVADSFEIVQAQADSVPVPADEQGRFVASNYVNDAVEAERPWPATLRVTFPLMGTNQREAVDVALGLGGRPGTFEMADDDLPATGLNAASLSTRAAAVAAVWVWSKTADFHNSFDQVQGVSYWCRATLGHDYRTAWSVQDVGGWAWGGSTICTSASAGFWRDRPVLRLVGSNGGGAQSGSGSGSASSVGRVIDYTYRDDCIGGLLYRFRNTWYQSYLNGLVYTTGYMFEKLNGCCACGSGSGSGSGSGFGSGTVVPIPVDCATIPATLTFLASLLSGSCGVGFPTGGMATSAGYNWTFGGTASCAGPLGGWEVVLTCNAGAGTLSATIYESQNYSPPVAIVTFSLTLLSTTPFGAAGVVNIPSTAGCCPSTTWLFEWGV